MGATESTRPEGSSKSEDGDTVANEESANNVQDGESIDAKLLQKNGQISGLSEKAEDKTEEVNVLCDDGVVAEVDEANSSIVSQKEDIPEMIETLTEEVPPLENTDSDGKESPDVDDEASTNETETDVKLNEVNDSFKKFFSSIGLKFTLKKDSDTIPEVSPKKEEGEARTPEDSKDTEETTIDNAEENTGQSTPEDLTDDTIKECVGHTPELVDDTIEANIDEAPNNVVADSPVEPADDSTSHPTMTDLTFEEFHNETTKEQTTEMIESKEEITPEEVAQAEGEAPPTPIPIVEEMSPFKRFFLTGKIHKQVKQPMKQPKEEPKEEVMEEVKEEPKTEPKEEVNEEPKTEPKEEVNEEPKTEPKEEVNEEPKDEVKEEVIPTEETDTPAPTIPDVEEEIISPIKKFFTTGIFAGLKKKKTHLGEETPKDETVEKEHELQSIDKQEYVNTPEEAGLEQEQIKDEISPDVETIPVIEGKQNENEVQETGTDSLMAETSNVPELMMSNVPKTSDNREDVLEEQLATEELQTIISNRAKLLSFQEEAKSQGTSVQDILEEQSPSLGFVAVLTNEAETNEDKLSSQEKAKSQESLEGQFHSWGFVTVTEHVPEEEPAPEVLLTVTSNEAETNEAKHLDSQEKAKSQGSPVQEEQSPSLGFHTVISNEAELLSSQEKSKNQGSPLRKLLYGAGLKKLSRKRRGKKSDELTRSGEHVTEDLLSSTESEEYQRGEHPASSTEELAAEEVKMSALLGSSHESDSDVTSDGERKKDGTWTSFKKLMTPIRCPKRSSESEDELAHEEPKQSEGEQVLERFTEETKKKVEISVSWEALLCGSAKRRGRKTSDSEEEAPMNEGETLSEPGNTAESPLDSSQEGGYEHLTSSLEEAVSPLGSEGGSTWKSLKKLVTSNRKAKTEEASKVSSPEQVASDSEITKEESSFSLKKLIPGRKKQKHGGKQEPISSDEADKGVGSDDEEDSETPAVVPMSEFDAEDLGEKHIILTEAVIETPLHITEEITQPDVSRLVSESAIPKDTLPTEAEKAQAKDTVEQLAPSSSPTATKYFEDLTEFISKHQQLSDIPEEGVIEETIATQVSTAEEATRDDTIAEDLIELTSEAVTAPEPLDDESTEMVSAVSQLTEESPKTSGNTTPVPAEYELKDTEVLLHEAVETINRTPTLSSVITKDPHLEAVTVSVSPQILQTPKETEATVLTAHEKSDAVTICTGEESQQIDAVDESPVTHVVECPLEVRKVVPTELAPEETEESGAARITTDEVHKTEDESIPIMHIEIEKDQQTELVNELEEVRPVLVATVNSEEGVAQVEGKAIAEDTPQPDTERLEVSVTDKLVFTQALTEITLKEEKEEFMDVSEDSADTENAPVAETITSDVQDVATAMPDVLKLESSNVLESLIGIVAPEVESPEKMDCVGALSPLVDSSMVQTLKKGDMVVRKNVPSAQFVDGLEIRVQVTDAEIKSAEETIETVLEVSSTDVNDHETLVQQVNAEIESAEANVDAVFEVVSTDVNHHETLVQQVNTEIESAEVHVETTLELGSTDDHEITVQVADAEIKSAQVIIENVLEVGLTDVTHHEIKVQEMDVVIESCEAIVDAVFVVLTDVKGHEIQVQVTDANAEIGTAEAILETALKVVSSTDVMEVIDICDKMEDKGEGENAIENIREAMFEEESSIITQEILQHVQQNFSEADSNVVPQSSEKAEIELTSEAEVSKSPEGIPVVAVTDAQGCTGVAAQVQNKIHLFENYVELNTQGNAHKPSDKETEPSISLKVDTVCEDRTTPETFAESTFEVAKDDIVPNTFVESCLQSNMQEVYATEAEFIIASEVDSDSISGHEKELVGMVVQSAKESVESFEKRLSIESHVHIHLHIEPRDAGVVSAGLDSPPLAIWPPPSTSAVNTDSCLKESIEIASTTAKSAVNTDCVPTESMESTQLCEVSQIEQTDDTAPPVPLHTPPVPLHTPPAPLHTPPVPLHIPPAPLLATPAPLHTRTELVVCSPNPEAEQVMMNAEESILHTEDENDQEVWLDAEEDFGTVKSHVLEVLSITIGGGVEEMLQVSEEVFDIALEPQSFQSISENK
ncbi:A-kinase anchor protein 12-like [Oncorhynchus nerka]|uniref:A-kinase anchor protein 12-like n=1 Tax=Oncorhynchus nerka TaxID=8023 RepID=UPI0031B8746D